MDDVAKELEAEGAGLIKTPKGKASSRNSSKMHHSFTVNIPLRMS